jgi:hypothetical protein
MRVSLSHPLQRSPEVFQQLRAWYKIRDTLFGENEIKQDVKKALNLAAFCAHPDAVWLIKLFAGRDVSTWSEARQVFRSCESDPRGRYFAAVLVWDFVKIFEVAELGDAYAQARMAGQTKDEKRFCWAEKSASQGERDGFLWLGFCFNYGKGCEEDLARAKELFFIASELGSVHSMTQFASFLDKTDPQRFVWLGKASAGGIRGPFLAELEEQIETGAGHEKVIFAIGRALKDHIDIGKRHFFEKPHYRFDALIGPINQAVVFFNFQLKSYRTAVDTWTLVGIRCEVVKDIRKMISKIIWDAREEAKYVEVK